MSKRSAGLLFFLVFLPTLLSASICPAGTGNPITVGEEYTIRSQILAEDRAILVSLPAHYQSGGATYPVLYLMDGKEHFIHVSGMVQYLARCGLIPEMIVVGVVNTDRARDFTPTHSDTAFDGAMKTSGGGGRFLQFLAQELIPYVEKGFRTQPYRLLAAHCLTGMFGIHVLLEQPALFQATLAVSPYLDWDGKTVLKSVEATLPRRDNWNNFLFVTYAGSGESQYHIDTDVQALEQLLKARAPKGLRWQVRAFTDDDHDTIVHTSLWHGLRTVFTGWRFEGEARLETLERHYQDLSRRFGFPIRIPENTLNLLGYKLLFKKDHAGAIAAFEHNVKLYPDSANVYDSLGEAYEAAGRLAEAYSNFQIAVTKYAALPGANPEIAKVYREHLQRVEANHSAR